MTSFQVLLLSIIYIIYNSFITFFTVNTNNLYLKLFNTNFTKRPFVYTQLSGPGISSAKRCPLLLNVDVLIAMGLLEAVFVDGVDCNIRIDFINEIIDLY